MSDLTNSLSMSASGLRAQAGRLNTISQNIANADTPGYRRKLTSFEAVFDPRSGQSTVHARSAGLDQTALTEIYDPSHPLADETGSYWGSNVSLMVEMADAREAQRGYEANLRSFDNARQMTKSLLELLRR